MPIVTVTVPDAIDAVLRPVYQERGQTLAEFVLDLVRREVYPGADDPSEHARYFTPAGTPAEREAIAEEVRRTAMRTPEQVEAARAALLATASPRRSARELMETMAGKMPPGRERDEFVRDIMCELT